jgi:hypothetical protein
MATGKIANFKFARRAFARKLDMPYNECTMVREIAPTFIDWANLKNPILTYNQWSIKDACCAWREGLFTVFFSAFDQERSHVAAVTTADLLTYSDFLFCLDGQAEGHIGLCSPDISCVDDTYILTLNSWGDDPDNPNQLFYMQSPDLVQWSERRPLAANLTHRARAIDAALAFDHDAWFLVYKDEKSKRPLFATAPTLDGKWQRVGLPALLMADGRENGLTHENFQLLKIDGRWRLLSTDYAPHHPYLYTMAGTGERAEDWLRWENGYRLEIPEETFNTVDRDNAAALYDWRARDGYFYLIYAGKSEDHREEFRGKASRRPWPRGWNKLALARSRDLVRWYPAGVPEDNSTD